MQAGNLVALYVRVSSQEQVGGFSLDAQEAALRAHARKFGKAVYKVYRDEGLSGFREDRAALSQLLRDAKAGCFTEVWVWTVSRVSRKLSYLLKVIDGLREAGVRFWSLAEDFDGETPAGRLVLQTMGAIAEQQRFSWMESSRIGTEKRVRQGRWTGTVPFGYRPVPDPADPRGGRALAVVAEEAEVVREAFELYGQGLGLRAVATRLNEAGRRTRLGKLFSVQSVRWILANPLYAGRVRLGKIEADGNHEAIVSQELWEKVQVRLAERSRPVRKAIEREHLLSGVLRCPECGNGMIPTHVKAKRKDGSVRLNHYYTCSSYLAKGRAACRANSVRAEEAEAKVVGWLGEILTSPFWLRQVAEEIRRRQEAERAPNEAERKALSAELAAVSKRQDTLLVSYEKGDLSREEFLEEAQTMKAQRESLQGRLGAIGCSAEEIGWTLADIQAAFRQFRRVLARASAAKKREIIRSLVQMVTVDEDRQVQGIELRIPTPGEGDAPAPLPAVRLRLAE